MAKMAFDHPDVFEIQDAVAYALRAINTKDALQYLVKFLDSPNKFARFYAVVGLVEHAVSENASYADRWRMNVGKPGIVPNKSGPLATEEVKAHWPTADEFFENETDYIVFWKNWWNEKKDKLLK
jgi:hypothetical protein